MLSRRSVRIKVMQLLFALNRDKDLSYADINKRYWEYITDTFNCYLFNLYIIVHIAEGAEEDEKKRKKKHLQNEKDKEFIPKLYTNELIQYLNSNPTLRKKFEALNFRNFIDKDYFRKIYQDFAKLPEYSDYVFGDTTAEDDLSIILELFRHCRKNELYNEVCEDNFITWFDDKSIVVGTVKKTLKDLPEEANNFFEKHYPDDETVKEFGENLLAYSVENDNELINMIKPTLKNWDHDRVAIIDMILLKMALTEMMHFPTIPTKVTLNEYVEISKMYSTPKSKDFINGILDRLLKELEKAGKINKEGRGLVS
jgi:N utilization substance protein B